MTAAASSVLHSYPRPLGMRRSLCPGPGGGPAAQSAQRPALDMQYEGDRHLYGLL